MKEGDYVVGINESDVKWSPHDEVVSLIKAAANSLKVGNVGRVAATMIVRTSAPTKNTIRLAVKALRVTPPN